jgi:hypothetical protein
VVNEHIPQVVRFHAELRRLRGRPDAVLHRSGVLTGYCLESLLDASRGAGRVDLALDVEPDPETLAWLQERLSRARSRGIRVFVSRDGPGRRSETSPPNTPSDRPGSAAGERLQVVH